MIRMTKFTDYGIVLLAHMAAFPEGSMHNVRDLARLANVPLPMAQKIFKELSKKDLVASQRGSNGGYQLSRPAEQITVLQMIAALEGSVSLTECSSDVASGCSLESNCPVNHIWHKVNLTLQDALGEITLKEMAEPLSEKLAGWLSKT